MGLAFLDISTGEFRVAEVEDREFLLAQASKPRFSGIACGGGLAGSIGSLNALSQDGKPLPDKFCPGRLFP